MRAPVPYSVSLLAAGLFSLSVQGCGYFDPNLYLSLRSRDAGIDGFVEIADTGPTGVVASGVCGDPATSVISATVNRIPVDTTPFHNTLAPNCSGHAALGNEGFLALDVVAGEYWHLHLQPDPADPASASRDPSIYLLSAGCDERACAESSDSCTGPDGEHFAFVASTGGRWYIGVDDRNPGGGHYLLDVIHPSCGANGVEHGEACDDGNLDDRDGCDHLCRSELSEASRSERIPNKTPVEANVLLVPTSGQMVVEGDIGGSDCFPDYFAVSVPDGASLDVTALDASELPCVDGVTARLSFSLLNADLTQVGGRRDINDCPVIAGRALAAGEYLIRLTASADQPRPEPYRMSVRLTP